MPGASLIITLLGPLTLWLPVDTASWWAGRRLGRPAAGWLVQHGVSTPWLISRCEHYIDRYAIGAVILGPWLPVPTALLYATTGWRRLPLIAFAGADATGTLGRTSIFLLIGYDAGTRATAIARDLSKYALVATGVTLLAVIGFIGVRMLLNRCRYHNSMKDQGGL